MKLCKKGSRRLTRMSALAALGLLIALAISACGGGGSSSGTTTSGGGGGSASKSAETARAESELVKRYKGEYGLPNPEAPPHKPGVNIWYVAPGFESPGAKLESEEFKTGAEELGWNPTIKDGKFSSTVQLSLIREAIREGAEAIVMETIDCETVKAGLQEAKAAGVFVVTSGSTDCNPPLFSGEVIYEQGHNTEFAKHGGEGQAIWAIAHTDAEAKVLLVYESDLSATKLINEGAKKRLEECATCEIVGEVAFTGTELGPPLQQKVEQALLKYPETTVVDGNYAAPVELSVVPAVRSSGKQVSVLGWEGEPNTIKLVHSGEQAMGVGYPLGWPAYASLDATIRLLAGEKEIGNSGAGQQIYDAEHNLPPEGQRFEPPIDFKKLYREAWGV